jgi:hypothetical protein
MRIFEYACPHCHQVFEQEFRAPRPATRPHLPASGNALR